MKRIILLTVLSAITTYNSYGQNTASDKEAITKTISELFLGMQKGDSALAHQAFAKEVTLATIFKDKEGNTKIKQEYSVADFMKAVGTPHDKVWYEETWNLQIQIDGDFAQAWCDYAFYLDKTFSHCGVDAFHLVRTKEGWKIFHLADTRRKSDCVIPADIQSKH